MSQWSFDFSRPDSNTLELAFTGHWCLDQDLPEAESLQPALSKEVRLLKLMTTELVAWDSAFVAFLSALFRQCERQGITIDQQELPEGVTHLLQMAATLPVQQLPRRNGGKKSLLFHLGSETADFFQHALGMLHFLGEITASFLRLLRGQVKFRYRDFWLEIEEVGPRALIIVSVISFLVGLILAYLGADQLRLVGAQIFIADLVAIGMVREMGALMTGVIIAGRTGAAFAAQLGTMQVNEEIDALKTLSIQPVDFLVLPRILALVLMVPLLTLYASFIGMLAGLLVAVTIFDIGVFEYYNETLRALQIKHFLVGLSKGGIYGAMVAYAGCLRGMQCGKSAESVGDAATSAVVTGILLITISATITTILYYHLGI